MSKKAEIEYFGENMAAVGDIIFNMAAPDPAVPMYSPRPKETSSVPFALWGDGNDFPQQVIAKVEADTEIGALLDWKGRLLQGKEVIAIQLIWNATKKDFDKERINDQTIVDFLADIPFQRYWREACTDFTWFQNIFPDMIKSKKGDTIATISCHHAAWTRLGRMDKTGTIKTGYVSAEWPNAKVDDEYTQTYTVVDPYNSAVVEETKANKALKRFIYPVSYASPGKAYYSLAPWIAFVNSSWYQIKNLIPTWKLKFMQRILSAAKTVVIPLSYWPKVHKDWNTLTKEQQFQIKADKIADISKKLTGLDGVGATILSEVGVDDAGQPIPSIKIESIESGFTDGQHLEDSQEASQHLMRALNVDPTLVGNGPGRGNDSGSGSDKRIAMNIATAILTPYRNVILEPLYFKAKYDGWFGKYPNLRFEVVEVDLGTLDQGPTSKVSNPVTPQNPVK
jgi:hypothetical protein